MVLQIDSDGFRSSFCGDLRNQWEKGCEVFL